MDKDNLLPKAIIAGHRESTNRGSEDRRATGSRRDKATNIVFSLTRKSFPEVSTETLRMLADFTITDHPSAPAYRDYTRALKIAEALTASLRSKPGEREALEREHGTDIYQKLHHALADRLMNLPPIHREMDPAELRRVTQRWENILPKNHSEPVRRR